VFRVGGCPIFVDVQCVGFGGRLGGNWSSRKPPQKKIAAAGRDRRLQATVKMESIPPPRHAQFR